MTPESREPTEVRATHRGRFGRIPPWARIALPVVVLACVAAVVAIVLGSVTPQPATAESLCRAAAQARLEDRGRSDIDLTRPLERTEADGAHRVSGTVTFDDESGDAHHAQLRCVIRLEGDAMRLTSVRFSE